MKIQLLSAFFTLFITVSALAQELPFEKRFEEASLLTEENELNQALKVWTDLAEDYPDNANVNYKTGRAYLTSFGQKAKALPYLQKAAQNNISENYNPYTPLEKNAPLEVYYYLGKAYHLNYKLSESIAAYQTFLERAPKKHYLRPQAETGIVQSRNAQQALRDSLDLKITNLGPVVNSKYPDFSPVISLDENSLFFTSRRLRPDSSNLNVIEQETGEYFEDIYISYKDRYGNWQEPELLNLNTAGHDATVNVSADGQKLYIYRDDDGDGNIYESQLVGETWTEPVKMNEKINSTAWETHIAVSADESTIYFVSNRKGGFGGRDIYRIVLLPNGRWSDALNLGSVINTPLDEDAVFVSPDGKTLYFSSQGHNSMGGFDVFTTTQDSSGNWKPPVNLGYPLNTVDDDVFFVTSADGSRGYFSSLRNDGYGEKDLYSVILPKSAPERNVVVLKGYIIPAPGDSIPENGIVYITNKQTGETDTYTPRLRDGVFVAVLSPCAEYSLDYRHADISLHNEYIAIPCEGGFHEIVRNIALGPEVALDSSLITADTTTTGENAGTEKVPNENLVKQTKTTVGDSVIVTTSKGDIEVTTTTRKGTTVYDRYFDYNQKNISLDNERFILFMNEVAELVKSKGQVTVTIEGSASTVPTKTFGNNQNLADQRAAGARETFEAALKVRNIDPAKVTIASTEGKVQGPAYKGDYLKGKEKYGKFQYAKIVVE